MQHQQSPLCLYYFMVMLEHGSEKVLNALKILKLDCH